MKGKHAVWGKEPREGHPYPRPPYECQCGFSSNDLRESVQHEKDNLGKEWEDDRPWPPTEEEIAAAEMMEQVERMRAAAEDEGIRTGVDAARMELEAAGATQCPTDEHVLGASWFYNLMKKRLEEL